MAKTYLKIETSRDGYSVGQVGHTVTVGDLIYELENYDEDTPIYLSFDNGYTYGGIYLSEITECNFDEDED